VSVSDVVIETDDRDDDCFHCLFRPYSPISWDGYPRLLNHQWWVRTLNPNLRVFVLVYLLAEVAECLTECFLFVVVYLLLNLLNVLQSGFCLRVAEAKWSQG
jgi:hypothetical protein